MIKAVEVAKAVQRIPQPQRRRITYFSWHDVWLYQAVMDRRVCPICSKHEETERFRGNHLRLKFPFLEIFDRDNIKVNAHPNCRCFLTRLLIQEE